MLAARALAWALIATTLCVALRAQARPLVEGGEAPAVSRRCWKHLVAERPNAPPELGLAERAREEAQALATVAPPPAALAWSPVSPPPPLGRAAPARAAAGPAPPKLPVYLRLLQLVL